MRISREQFAQFDAAATRDFRANCVSELKEAFPEIEAEEIERREPTMWADCQAHGFETERSVQCYYHLSFLTGQPMVQDDTFKETHTEYIQKYGSADQLPIDILETTELWFRC